ncbi:phage portal protein [Fructilactobacillus fructivorans]|uniref:Phage portal protein n=1 Tax=Fructilactobacillus fructivorans TaxID=1614 RepID=A0AAE6TW24_9LACO|nr:phage portal protein [Fructilactobacillus fructivorans]QFX92506.1 phage portal protein [Fructilactobacillus fructivorans]RDV65899.1 phage portal protein [Fructilactobacillus fructivorans]
MPVFNFNNKISNLGSTIGASDDSFGFSSPTSNQLSYVSASQALQNSDIYSIIFQLSGALASGEITANNQRAQNILDNPSATASTHAFWQSMFAQLLIGGESFAYRFRNANGTDSRLEYLRPSQVSTYLLSDGSGLIYNANFDEPDIGTIEAIPQSDMIHFRLLSKNGGMTGVSPLSALSSELNIKNSSNKLTLKALAQAVTSSGILKVKNSGLLNSKEKQARSRKATQELRNGVLVLDDLEDYQPLEMRSNIANLLDQANWTGSQIAKVYGIPDSMINGKGDQQSSIQMENISIIKSLANYVNPIVSELKNKLNTDVHMDVRKAVDPLGDQYASTLSGMTKDGTLTANQTVSELQHRGFLPDDLPARQK